MRRGALARVIPTRPAHPPYRSTMTVTDAPTTELGFPGGLLPAIGTLGGPRGGYYVDGLEVNADLRFPAATVVQDRMRREDGQVGSVLRAIVLPIIGTGRSLIGEGVRPEVLRFLRNELGLDATAGRARRRREGIVLTEHVRESLLMLPFGFMPFEQLYTVGPAAPGLEDPANPRRLYAHLRKLAPRMPRTLMEVRVDRDGGLAGIVQQPPPGANGAAAQGVFIPVDRLLMYVNDREGADWTGTSVLRSAYKHWLIKDALIRLGAQIVERNGMGVPVARYTDPNLKAEALRVVKAFRAGAQAGAVLPQGITLDILGVAGSTADELPRVKYHDEAIGRSLLAMFLNLGHDNGARALGDTFVGIFRDSLTATMENLAETFTEHVIRDLVELNYGPDEPYPVLRFDPLTEELTAEGLKALADGGIITHDDALEADVRRRYSLPAIDLTTRPAPVAPAAPVVPAVPAPNPFAVTAAGEAPDLVDRLAALTDRVAALRIGHGQG